MQLLIDQATQTPGGYLWWHSLPCKGRRSQSILMKKWTKLLLTILFPQELLTAMVLAALSPHGIPTPTSKPLYNWLIANVYKGKAALLYKDWYSAQAYLTDTQ